MYQYIENEESPLSPNMSPLNSGGILRRIFACILLIGFILTFVSTNVTAKDTNPPRIVKVGHAGYQSKRDVFTQKNDSFLAEYNQEYLDKIAKINNWEYVYVEGTMKECLTRLATGEIDLLGPLQYSDERDEVYAFPNMEFGYDYSALYCYKDSDAYYFEDFKSFNNMKVGVLANNYNNKAFTQYCIDNNFSVKTRVYQNNSKLIEALELGDVDAIVAGQFVGSEIVKTIAAFSYEKYYYATTKGNDEILDGLNSALFEIKTNHPEFQTELYEKYSSIGNKGEDLFRTRDEANYIVKNPIVTISSFNSWETVSKFNSESNSYSGAAIDIAGILSDKIKLGFRTVHSPDKKTSMEMLDNNQISAAVVINDSYDDKNYTASLPFLKVPLAFVGKKQALPLKEARIAVALSTEIGDVHSLIPDDSLVIDCVDAKACLEAVKNGEADATIVDTYSLDYINKTKYYGNLNVLKMLDKTVDLSFVVKNTTDPNLLALINKGISKLSNNDIEKVVLENTIGTTYQMRFSQVFKDYLYVFIIVFTLVPLIAFIFFFYHRRNVNAKTQTVAYTDALLGIRNFEKFKLDAHAMFNKFRREDFSMIYFDVNRFKYINDNFGYKVGNDILVHVAKCASEILYDYEIFARVSADNFVMMLKNTDEKQIVEIIKKLSRSVQSYKQMLDVGHKITLCFGIYRMSGVKEDFFTTLDRANAARRNAKGSHETTYAFYDEKMLRKLATEIKLTESMKPALDNNEFKLFLQPKHNVADGKIIGAEALVRWASPTMGLIQPNNFIPVMEKNGFITQVDFFIYESVCRLMRSMIDSNLPIIPISVNLSRVHFESRTFIHTLNDIAQSYKIPTSLIELELTESMILQNQREVLDIMQALKQIGFRLSLDDFGTGFSSLSLLMEMPVDVLKLDKSFLNEVVDTGRERTIINDIVHMAHHLDMCVVCEGVETPEHYNLLKDIKCDIAQGYFFSKPLTIQEYLEYIDKQMINIAFLDL